MTDNQARPITFEGLNLSDWGVLSSTSRTFLQDHQDILGEHLRNLLQGKEVGLGFFSEHFLWEFQSLRDEGSLGEHCTVLVLSAQGEKQEVPGDRWDQYWPRQGDEDDPDGFANLWSWQRVMAIFGERIKKIAVISCDETLDDEISLIVRVYR